MPQISWERFLSSVTVVHSLKCIYQLHQIAPIFWAKHQVAIELCLNSGMMFFFFLIVFGIQEALVAVELKG